MQRGGAAGLSITVPTSSIAQELTPMLNPLDPIVSDKLAAGGILAGLKLARWAFVNPDYVVGRPYTPPAFYRAWENVRALIWDTVDECNDINRSHGHADAIVAALGLTGVLERASAVDHHRRQRSVAAAEELAAEVDRQLTGAITRLTSALAEPAPSSN